MFIIAAGPTSKVWNTRPGGIVVCAPPCSTWISINIGTSKRSILVPGGDETLVQNRKANKLACRTGFVQSDLSIWGHVVVIVVLLKKSPNLSTLEDWSFASTFWVYECPVHN